MFNFYPENYFHKMLILERKRTERSGKQFLLMLIDIHKIKKISETFKMLIKTLDDFTREIDIKGWYKKNRVLGVIYPEIDVTSEETIMEKIKGKINNTLDTEQKASISISYLSFPEKNGQKEGDRLNNNTVLYKDLSTKKMAKKVSIAFKRIIDITGSIFGISLFSPVLLIISIIIKLSSKGTVFFRQKRVGYSGKEFTLLKFRSMHINNDNTIHKEFTKNFINGNNHNNHESKNGIYKIKDDPRITKIGKFIRKTSLDELPQLFNVLKGDMSLVGPRPALSYEVEEYDTWHKRRVFEIKPGITGIWQVKGRSKTTFDEMVRMDIQYINKQSILWDVMLILRTPFAVFRTKGAY